VEILCGRITPGYAKLDVTAGASYRTWSVSVFGNNLTDRRGTLSGGLGTIYPRRLLLHTTPHGRRQHLKVLLIWPSSSSAGTVFPRLITNDGLRQKGRA